MTRQSKIRVIKVGGSALFKKGELDLEVIKPVIRLVEELSDTTFLVIGCGERLHKLTLDSNLTDKPLLSKSGIEDRMHDRLVQFFEIQQEVNQNLKKIATLSSKLSLVDPTELFVKYSHGSLTTELSWFNDQVLQKTEHILITSGGLVFDRNILFSAISSDTIAAFLATYLKADELIILTDTNGVYESLDNPRTIPLLDTNNLSSISLKGGMKDKIRRIKPAIKEGIQTFIGGMQISYLKNLLINGSENHFTKVV